MEDFMSEQKMSEQKNQEQEAIFLKAATKYGYVIHTKIGVDDPHNRTNHPTKRQLKCFIHELKSAGAEQSLQDLFKGDRMAYEIEWYKGKS